jgi:bacterioferritin-associated ferredoxin
MYVCVCAPFTDKQVREALDNGADSVTAVYRALDHKVQCGKCIPTVRAMVAEHRAACRCRSRDQERPDEAEALPMAAE